MAERDIVDRLRAIADASRRQDGSDIPLGEHVREAADLITTLRSELAEQALANARLRIEKAALMTRLEEARKALDGILSIYVQLVNCGDCGHWNPEVEPEVIAARAAIRALQPAEETR